METFIGMISAFGFNFTPRSWVFCAGELLAINQFQAVFALLGTQFGGDGRTSFGIPDLRGRSPVGMGAGPGLVPITIGERAGSQHVTLGLNNLPAHKHNATFTPTGGGAAFGTLEAATEPGTSQTPAAGSYLATVTGLGPDKNIYVDGPQTATVELGGLTISGGGGGGGGTVTVANSGGSNPVNILNPFQGVNYCIAMEGIFPSRE